MRGALNPVRRPLTSRSVWSLLPVHPQTRDPVSRASVSLFVEKGIYNSSCFLSKGCCDVGCGAHPSVIPNLSFRNDEEEGKEDPREKLGQVLSSLGELALERLISMVDDLIFRGKLSCSSGVIAIASGAGRGELGLAGYRLSGFVSHTSLL